MAKPCPVSQDCKYRSKDGVTLVSIEACFAKIVLKCSIVIVYNDVSRPLNIEKISVLFLRSSLKNLLSFYLNLGEVYPHNSYGFGEMQVG